MRSKDDSKPIHGTPEIAVRDEGSAPAAEPQDSDQPTERRLLTVITSTRPNGRVPHICMSGKWLERAGFASGSRLAVTVTAGQLVLTVAAPPVPMPVRELSEPDPGFWSPRTRHPRGGRGIATVSRATGAA